MFNVLNIRPYLWLALILLAPLAYGLNPTWAWQGAAYIALSLTVFGLISPQLLQLTQNTKTGLFCTVLMLIYTLAQAFLPAPSGSAIAKTWQSVAEISPNSTANTLSIAPNITLQETGKWLFFALTFMAVLTYRQHSAFQRAFFPAFLAVAGFVTLYGFISPTHIWGLEKPMYSGATTGTFLNKNTYAAYAGAALLTSLFFGWRLRYHPQRFIPALLALSSVLQTVGLLTSHSRAGITCTLLAGVLLLAITTRKYWLLLIPLLFSPLALLLPLHDFLTDLILRSHLYKAVLNGIIVNPIWGSGLGTLNTIFPSLRVPEMPLIINSQVTQAHNTYLETALEIGLPATLLLALAFVFLTLPIVKRLHTPHSTTPLTLAILALFALHSTVDFTLEIPAITLFALALLAKSQSLNNNKTTSKTSIFGLAILGAITLFCLLHTVPAVPQKSVTKAELSQYLAQNSHAPYTWAHLAHASAEENNLPAALQQIEQSQRTGPYETRLLFYRIDLTAPLFNLMNDTQKNLFIRDVKSAHRHAPERIFRRLNRPSVAYALTGSSNPK